MLDAVCIFIYYFYDYFMTLTHMNLYVILLPSLESIRTYQVNIRLKVGKSTPLILTLCISVSGNYDDSGVILHVNKVDYCMILS